MPTQCKPLSFAFQGCQGRRVAAAFRGRDHLERRSCCSARSTVRWGSWTRWQVASPTPRPGTLGRDAGEAARHGHHPGIRRPQRPSTSCGTVLALLSGKLEGHRKDCAPLAGKSTLNRLEHAPPSGEPGRYHRIGHDADARCRPCCSSRSSTLGRARPSRLVLDIDTTDDEVHGRQEGRFFHGYYGHYCFLPLYITCGGRPLFAQLGRATRIPPEA